jgi:hypothetical protein
MPEFKIPEFKKPEININLTQKQIQSILIGILSVVVIVLLFVFIGMMRSRLSSSAKLKPTVKTTAPVKKPVSKAPEKTVSQASPKTTGTVILKIKAKGEVWIKVVEGDKRLFVGTLKTGESKTWKSKGMINVWTGNAGNLDFTVNKKPLGTVAAGVEKNIRVTSGGVRIGNKWVKRLD